MSGSSGTTDKPIPKAIVPVGGKSPTGTLVPLKVEADGSLDISGSIVASNPSVGLNGATAPTSSTEIGIVVAGNLQPISASNPAPVTVIASVLPTGAATSTNQTTANASLSSIDSKLTAPLSVTGPLTDAQLRASAVPVSAAALPLPAGAATSALQTSGNSSLSSIDGKLGSLGQKTMAGSAPVVIASDQSAIPVSGTVTASLPTDISPALQGVTTQDVSSTTTAVANGQIFITGVPATNSTASFAISTETAIEVQVTGTWTGTLSSEISMDGGVTWLGRGVKQSSSAYISTTFTQNFQGGLGASGITNYRIRATAAMTGTAIVKIVESVNVGSVIVSNAQLLRDSTTQSVLNTIKPASVAAIATDTALVVAISPNNTVPVSAASLPLPSGASTSANQTNGNQKGQVVDGSGNVIGSQAISAVNYLNVVQASSATSGSAVVARSTQIAGTDGTNARTLLTDSTGILQVNASTLPTGAATAANQTSVIGSKAPGTAATSSELVGGIYTAAGITLTDGQQAAMQLDSGGRLATAMPDIFVTGAAAQTATVNNILTAASGAAATDISGFRSVSVQLVSTGTGGTFLFEGSNDNSNFITVPFYNQVILTGTPITAAVTASASQIIYTLPANFRYLRLRIVTTITGGSIQAFSRFSQAAWTPAVNVVAQTTGANLSASISAGTITSVTNSNLGIPNAVTDVASAALTTTTTTAAVTPTNGSTYAVAIPVTVVSGTAPTMQVTIQESADSGTNWYTVYSFPIITVSGNYFSPQLSLTGNRLRYVQTITGTTPSFTRSIVREQQSSSVQIYKNLIDTTINTTSTNSVTASLACENTSTYTAIVNQGTGGSAVTFAMDGSDDSVNWVSAIAQCVGVVGGATPQVMTYTGANFRFIRVRVVTGIASSTISSISIVGSQVSNSPTVKPQQSVITNRSGTASTSSGQVAAANLARKYFLMQNLDSAITIYINFTSNADVSANSIALLPFATFVLEGSFMTTEAINVIAASGSPKYAAKEG